MRLAVLSAALGPSSAQAQGLDINDLLRGGTGDTPERTVPAPVDPGLTDRLRGAPPWQAESAADSPLLPAPPVLPFAETALAGRWTGVGAQCAGQYLDLTATDGGYAGTFQRRNARSGRQVVTRIAAQPDKPWQGAPHPLQDGAFFSFARQYAAQVTPPASTAPVPEGGWPLTLILAREAETGALTLRFLEPVTVCAFAREGG
ncbi:hypothetical protein MAA8898_00644 [Maliponia aquimaris]|uniref:Uncharacterized protein n=2 Tax=Maliponia aquimaris TaxID=1673631 RepID=A0A238JYP1_9RHOB|nr:hypothetical protein MAA8898_00644 [Maliponia aquimaris]